MYHYLCDVPRIDHSIKTEARLVVARDWEGVENKQGISFGGECEYVLKLDSGDDSTTS